MARAKSKTASHPTRKRKPKPKTPKVSWLRRVRRWTGRGFLLVIGLGLIWIAIYAVIQPPTTPYIRAESRRLGGVERTWVPYERIAPVMARAVVAAEDANYCLHWGVDMRALRNAIEDGGQRGASTISQQTAKNAFLWQGRSYLRKALEAAMTPVVELIWTKRRILEVYLNVAEFDEGVFGVEAASRHYFGVAAADLSAMQAARLAAVLPSPKTRSASKPSAFIRRRATAIADGAETILQDGRAACFQD